jgi:hypothetical protein
MYTGKDLMRIFLVQLLSKVLELKIFVECVSMTGQWQRQEFVSYMGVAMNIHTTMRLGLGLCINEYRTMFFECIDEFGPW